MAATDRAKSLDECHAHLDRALRCAPLACLERPPVRYEQHGALGATAALIVFPLMAVGRSGAGRAVEACGDRGGEDRGGESAGAQMLGCASMSTVRLVNREVPPWTRLTRSSGS